MLKRIIGAFAVLLLKAIGRLPPIVATILGEATLPVYALIRKRTRRRLVRLQPPVSARTYYRMRLRLALQSLQHFNGRYDGSTIRIEGSSLYADALASGNPVVLFGWHQGPVELLHQIPARNAPAHPFFLMTASAFSPELAEWMSRGRRISGVTVIRPGDTALLRGWARCESGPGVLALMIDQVPGQTENWMTFQKGRVRIPIPTRLLDWIGARRPECLAVSVVLEGAHDTVFRFTRVRPEALRADLSVEMEKALTRAPEQYNWSYGKIAVGG